MKFLLALLFLVISIQASAFKATPCSPERQIYLRSIERQAVRMINTWDVLLRYKYGAVAGAAEQREQRDIALDVALCAQDRLQRGLSYYCVSDKKRSAWTLPIIGREVYLSEEHFWPSYLEYHISTLIHEATHKCGTNDATYFRRGEKPRNHGIFGWSTIADTYSYWGTQGLCLPDIDC